MAHSTTCAQYRGGHDPQRSAAGRTRGIQRHAKTGADGELRRECCCALTVCVTLKALLIKSAGLVMPCVSWPMCEPMFLGALPPSSANGCGDDLKGAAQT